MTIIVLVAAFAIIGHLVLLVAEKRKEIGILKAMGASPGQHHRGVLRRRDDASASLGRWPAAPSGSALIWVQNTYKIIRLAGDVYQIDHLPDEAHARRLRS